MRKLKNLDLNDLVFFDIETVNAVKVLEAGTPLWEAWNYKMKYGREPLGGEDVAKSYVDQAALYPEFGRIVCITIGKIKDNILKLKSYVGDDEEALLKDFCNALTNIVAANKKTTLVGHAIKGFDIPWIVRRCIVNQVEIPAIIDTADEKPWNILHLDTLELWKGSAFNSASLIAIATTLGLVNPKDKLAGYETSKTYYNEPDGLEQIRIYCEKDVTTVANIVRKCRYEPIVQAENGEIKVKQVGVMNRVFNTNDLVKADEQELMTNYAKLDEKEKVIAKEIMAVVTKK